RRQRPIIDRPGRAHDRPDARESGRNSEGRDAPAARARADGRPDGRARGHRADRDMMVRLIVVAFIAAELCAIALAAEPEASPGEWKFISDKDGVTIYRRQRRLSKESKAIGDIAASTDLVHAVIDDAESYTTFMPYTAECRVLKRDADSVVAYQRISAPMVSDRD